MSSPLHLAVIIAVCVASIGLAEEQKAKPGVLVELR